MIAFLLYLLESALCLSVLFGIYLLFFRQETFFTFNRFYLIGAMLFSLLIPAVHISVSFQKADAFALPANEISRIKSYYSRIIALTDPEFSRSMRYNSFRNAFENADFYTAASSYTQTIYSGAEKPAIETSDTSHRSNRKFPLALIIMSVYLAGIALFFLRLAGLFLWIRNTIRKGTKVRKNSLIIVQLKEEIPPFSFFRYVFVNEGIYNKGDFDKIIAHESTHISQKHSFDLLLAQCLNIFHWFNPLAWQLQKAIKINHEYLADSHIADQGFELFDYQSLLLTQLISIRSVELVNNFNLLSIKKRIAMMNKNQSGFAAKMKILLIVPFTLALFIFFADMTFYGPSRSFSNFISLKDADRMTDFHGVWENLDAGNYGPLVSFDDHSFSVLEENDLLRKYKAWMDDSKIYIELSPGEIIDISYIFRNSVLQIFWGDSKMGRYRKMKMANSLEYAIGDAANELDLPSLEKYVIANWPEPIDIVFTGKRLIINKQEGTLNNIDYLVKEHKAAISKLDLHKATVRLFIDKKASMNDVDVILNSLRDNSLLKVVFMGTPSGEKDALLAHTYGRTFKLPPKEGIVLLNDAETKKQGITVHHLDADKLTENPSVKQELKKTIETAGKYITPILYSNSSSYGKVIGYCDLVFAVNAQVRGEYAVRTYKKHFEELGLAEQDLVMNKFPMTVLFRNIENLAAWDQKF